MNANNSKTALLIRHGDIVTEQFMLDGCSVTINYAPSNDGNEAKAKDLFESIEKTLLNASLLGKDTD